MRQELEGRIAEYQARVAQEVAIAKRIDNALEVENEEFYDTSGEGQANETEQIEQNLQHRETGNNL